MARNAMRSGRCETPAPRGASSFLDPAEVYSPTASDAPCRVSAAHLAVAARRWRGAEPRTRPGRRAQ